jgi:hypothetical protein
MYSHRGVSTTTYWQMTHTCGFCEKTILHGIWLVDLKANLHKANFILQLFSKLSFKILVYKGQDNPHTLHVN